MNEIVCTSCGYTGEPVSVTKGSMGIELILWLCFLIPGLIYSVWRLSSRQNSCPKCEHTTIIPIDSPMGQKFIAENLPKKPMTEYKLNKNGVAYKLGRLFRKRIK